MSDALINQLAIPALHLIYKGVTTTSQYLTMPDGVKIAIDVMRPANAQPSEKLPTLMIMARYWRSLELRVPYYPDRAPKGPRENSPDYFIGRGFNVVAVDGRGTGASMGFFAYPWSTEEIADYGVVADWIIQQKWSNGNIGAYGISYEGATAQRLITTGGQAVKGVIPQEIEYDVYTDIALPGGIFNQTFIENWHASNEKLDNNKPSNLFPFSARLMVKGVRPVDEDRKSGRLLNLAIREHQANTNVFEAIKNITYRDDPFGDTGATLDDFSLFPLINKIEENSTAILSWGSWLDGATAESALRTFHSHNNPQILIIGAWKHEMTTDGSPYQRINQPSNPSQKTQWEIMARFFQQTLVDEKPPQGKTVYYYTLGEETWKQAETFPPAEAQMQTWYFDGDNTLSPDKPTTDGSDSYQVNFDTTTGTTNRWHTQFARPVVYKDRAKEDQKLLTYTSAPLDDAVEITGYGLVTLYLQSDREDGAFFAYLEDVDPKGVVCYITEGQIRGLHRKISDQPAPYVSHMPHHTFKREDAQLLPINQVTEITFGFQPTSVLIKKGHRIRIALAGADKETFARIPADGNPTWEVFRNTDYLSHVQLPIIKR